MGSHQEPQRFTSSAAASQSKASPSFLFSTRERRTLTPPLWRILAENLLGFREIGDEGCVLWCARTPYRHGQLPLGASCYLGQLLHHQTGTFSEIHHKVWALRTEDGGTSHRNIGIFPELINLRQHFHHQRSGNRKRLLLFKQEVVSSKQLSNIHKVINDLPCFYLFLPMCATHKIAGGAALFITLIYALDS